jgi:hypothetical protein
MRCRGFDPRGLYPDPTEGQEAPWKERWELNLLPQLGLAPTTSERLAATEILLVHTSDLTSNPQTGGYNLAVHPWEAWNGGTPDLEDPDNWPFCHDDDPFYGQPTPGRGCSGFLVAPDLVVTAGHCIAGQPPESQPPYDCSHRYVVFDYAFTSDTDPLGQEWMGGPVALSGDQVVQCDTVLVDTHIISPPPDPLEVFVEPPMGSGDWALLRLAEAVDDRLPVPIERFAQTAVDDPILVLGHPARIPVKAEFAQVTGQTTGSFLHALGGSSGSPIFNLDTGKIAGVLTSSGVDGWANVDDANQCVDLCFECPGTLSGGTPATLFTADVPAIGVQVSQVVTSVDHYGPPTSALDYEPCGR